MTFPVLLKFTFSWIMSEDKGGSKETGGGVWKGKYDLDMEMQEESFIEKCDTKRVLKRNEISCRTR